jgi:signal recognition particle receptor subunit beta
MSGSDGMLPLRPQIVARQRDEDEKPLKIVVTGPFSAGKTTFVRTISEGGFLGTDRSVTDASRDIKPQTTVAMDFGRLEIGPDLNLQLVGTPGQQRFDVMWEILARGMLGFVLLVDPGAPDSLAEAAQILTAFQGFRDVPFVVAATHLDGRPAPYSSDLQMVRGALGLGAEVPVIGCDPRVKEDVKGAVIQLLTEIMGAASAGRSRAV